MTTLTNIPGIEDMVLRVRLQALQDAYVSRLDAGELERWPELFTEGCRYEIIPRENEVLGLPAPLILCEGKAMLRDRVISLLHANIYGPQIYRHFVSGLTVEHLADGAYAMRSSYVVINTSQLGESVVYQAGRYHDEVVEDAAGELRFRSKRCIYDTSRVQTLLAIPV